MSNITFPAVGAPYRGFVDKLRNWLREAGTQTQKNPGSKTAILAQIKAFVAAVAGTSTVITTAQTLTGVAPTGVFATTVTFTVAGGVITAITLS
jgi:hypothetical protein